MEFVWQSSGTPARRRTRQDKECRSRKKRCYHTEEETGPAAVDSPQEPHSALNTRDSSPSQGRVGEYNPESVLEDLAAEASPGIRRTDDPTHSKPARALARHPEEQAAIAAQRAQRQSTWYKTHKRRAAAPKLSDSHRKYLEEAGAFLELPKSTTDALLPIYITVLDDLVPLLDGAAVFRDHSNGHSSAFYVVRAMCLVICKAKQAAPFLRMTDGGPVLHPLQFASKLLAGLDAAIKADLEPEKVIKIQILALMHLHNDGLSGLDRASKYLSQAICEAWSVSLHFDIQGNDDQEQCDYLWWTLRNLDRLNKPVMGATPFMIDDLDISIKRLPIKKDSYRSQLMGASVALGDLMTKATKIYKATSTATEDDNSDFPSLSEVAPDIDLNRFHRSHREYLEIWYHVTAMLSCRYSGPKTIQYNRRLESADRILSILSQDRHEDLTPLPLVPHAMSITTCVIYRALRDETRDSETAYKDLRRCCEVLDSLSQRWTSTKGMSKLAKRLWSAPKTTPPSHPQDESCRPHKKQRRTYSVGDQPIARSWNTPLDPTQPTPVADGRGAALPTPLPFDQRLQYDPVIDGYQAFVDQPVESWDGSDGSFTNIDSVVHEIFDYNLPNAFRNPTSWEYLNLAADEGFSTYLP